MLIGEIIGEVSTDSFTFEAYKEIRKFDFVTVKNPKEGKEWILAQVDKVKKSQEGETTCEASIIGFREKGMLKQPRHVVKPDSMVYRADEDVIAETLGLTTDGLYMGRLETNPDIRIFVDPSDLYKHIAVLAKTGAGKSYATGVMLEELLEANYPVIVIDPHGEYHSLAHPNDDLTEEQGENFDIDAKGYNITEYSTDTDVNPDAERLSFSSKNLKTKELAQLMPTNLTNSQKEVMYNALKELKDREEYDLDDIMDKCMSQDSKAKWNLVSVLEIVQESGLFSDDPTPLDSLVRRGHCSIVNLRGVDPETQQMIVYKLAKELFERRKVGELVPFIMVMEEAHNFVPEANLGKAVCSDIMRTIASEGRKFGMGIGVISQRPANVNKNILSQCNTQLIMRVTNKNDLSAISRSFEGITSEVQQSLTSLPPGTGLLLGKEYPVMTSIRTRRSKHGGVTQELDPDAMHEDADGSEQTPADADPVIEPDASPDTSSEPDSGPAPEPDPASEEPASQPVAADTAGAAADTEDLPSVDHETADRDAPEPDGPQATSPETAAGHGGTDESDAGEDGTEDGLEAIVPGMDVDKLREDLGEVKTAYYPLWIISSEEERIAVDATDGEIKAREKRLSSTEERVLDEIREGAKTRGNLLEALGLSLSKLERTLESLEEKSMVEQEDDQYMFNGVDLLDRDTTIVTGDGHTEISTDVSESDAISIAKQELSGPPDSIEKLYYPYFTADKRVFDGVLGEEI